MSTPPDPLPTIGLIVPPAHGQVPGDAERLYGGRARFIARGVGLGAVSPTGFDAVIDTVVDRARELRDAGARAISLMGTSISFYRGCEAPQQLCDAMQRATGVPCTTMSHAAVRALQALGIARVAIATAYIDELNDRLVDYLRSSGIAVTAIRGLGVTGVEAVGQVTTRTLVDLSEAVHAADTSADGVFISCGGLQTMDAIVELERRLAKPVTSSSTAGFWDVMRLAGRDADSPGHGRLFDARGA